MKLNGKEILDNINIIDNILKDDLSIESYIVKIENDDLTKAPIQLKNNILSKCESVNKKNKQKNNVIKMRYTDIFKLVACAVFAVVIWEGSITVMGTKQKSTQDIANNTVVHQEIQRQESIFDKVNEGFRNFSRQVVTPADNKKDKGDIK